MNCPFCGAKRGNLAVRDSRAIDKEAIVRRRRECLNCGKRFTTAERATSREVLMVRPSTHPHRRHAPCCEDEARRYLLSIEHEPSRA